MRNVPNSTSVEQKINQICKEQEIKYANVEAVADSHCYCVFMAVSHSVFSDFFFQHGDIRRYDHNLKPECF